MQLHCLVTSNDNQLGIGKLIAFDNSWATVEYFCSVAKRFSVDVAATSLKWVKLPVQTRCYIYHAKNDTWIIGRVYEWDEENQVYQIDLPDSQTTCAPETVIFARCFVANDDPMDILAIKAHETPYFHNLRSRLVASLIRQRATSQGMTGLLSANIPLCPHQVSVVRQVLSSPIARYLLNDSSASDRLTTASVILRQFLLDYPELKALIIVPGEKVEQWTSQLEAKIYLSEFAERVTIQSLEDQKLPKSCGFLLVDEAQQLTVMATAKNLVFQDYFERVKRLTQHCKTLLLLSGLPVLNNEAEFLGMLHLLDPDNYPLTALDVLKGSITKRQEVGHLLLTSPDSNVCLPQAYQLSSHLLRTNLIVEENPISLKLEYDLDERSFDILELLENWRSQAKIPEYQDIFYLFYQGNSTWLGILQRLIESRLKGKINQDLSKDFDSKYLKSLTETKKFSGEESLLENILKVLETPSEDGDRLKLLQILLLYNLAEILQLQSFRADLEKLAQRVQIRIQRPFATDKFPKIVIFTSYIQTAKVILEMLSSTFGKETVVSHCAGNNRETVEKNFSTFKNDPRCFLMVCDRFGESGKSLEFAQAVIHFDLPFIPQAFAHRLTRVRALESGVIPPSWLLAGLDDPQSLEGAWYQLLQEGINIFNRSIIPLKPYLEQKLPSLKTILWQEGAEGIIKVIPLIEQEISQEELLIKEQNILDDLDIQSPEQRKFFQALEAHDSQTESIEKAVEGWLCNVLKFNRKYAENLYDLRSYQLTKRTLIPRHELTTFFPSSGLEAGVFSRKQANEAGSVHLYRLGEKLIDHLYSYLQWDDRGQAFALGRVEENTEWAGFRFDYIIEADLTPVQPLSEKYQLNALALKRQADGLFPPQMQTIFVDLNLALVEEEKLLKVLSRPYHKAKDFSLAKTRLGILEGFVEASQWKSLCEQARAASENLLRHSGNFLTLCQTGQAKAQEHFSTSQEILEQREKYYPHLNLESNRQLQQAWQEKLLQGIQQPSIKLDAVGFIVVSEQIDFE